MSAYANSSATAKDETPPVSPVSSSAMDSSALANPPPVLTSPAIPSATEARLEKHKRKTTAPSSERTDTLAITASSAMVEDSEEYAAATGSSLFPPHPSGPFSTSLSLGAGAVFKSPQDMGLTPVVLPAPKRRKALAKVDCVDDASDDSDLDHGNADEDDEETMAVPSASALAAPGSGARRNRSNGAAEYPNGAPETHKARKGGSMKSLRTVSDTDDAPQNLLKHYASQLGGAGQPSRGLFHTGPLEVRGLGRKKVKARISDRDKGLHTQKFRAMTGGESSSTQYQVALGTAQAETSYQILHGMGHGEGGGDTQVPDNLASASSGANTEMIPPDKAISGNSEVSVDTRFSVRAGTHRAERISMQYYHDRDPAVPFYSNTIDGDRPEMTRSEYDQDEHEVAWMGDAAGLSTAVQQRRANREGMHRELLAHPRFNPVAAAAAANHPASRPPDKGDEEE